MVIERKTLQQILNTITKISDKKFDIKLQYKFIKLQKSINEEYQIYQTQLFENCKEFFVMNDAGEFNISNGGYAIKPEKIKECEEVIKKIDSVTVEIPDIYFTLNELEELELTYNELMAFECFIKE